MPVSGRGQAIVLGRGSTGNGRNPMNNGRRQPSGGGRSRMNREVQVRICERLGVKFPGPTRRADTPPAKVGPRFEPKPVIDPVSVRISGVTEYQIGTAASVRLDVEGLDHLAPLLGFIGDVFSEVRGRAHKRRTAQVSKPRFRVAVGEYHIDLPVELVDDLGGRSLWRAHAVPRTDLVAWDKLAYGRKVR